MNNHTKLPLQRITHDETNTNRCTGSRLFVTRIDAAFIQNKVNKKTKKLSHQNCLFFAIFFFWYGAVIQPHSADDKSRMILVIQSLSTREWSMIKPSYAIFYAHETSKCFDSCAHYYYS